MSQRLVKAGRVAALSGIALLVIVVVCSAAGMRINTSRSIAVGIYWTSAGPVTRGSYVMFCPPDIPVMSLARERGYLATGYCPGGFGYLMKQVAALAGNVVTVTEKGVSVDGFVLPLSAPLERDGGGQRLPRLAPSRFVIGENEVFMMSDVSATSFDSRYYGPIARRQMESVIVPVLTW